MNELKPIDKTGQDFLRKLEERDREYAAMVAKWSKCPKCADPLDPRQGPGCPKCSAAEAEAQRDRDRDIRRLGGLKAYQEFTLDRYDNKEAVEACAGFPDHNFYLWGAAGVGKSHLATAIVRGYREAYVLKPQHIFRKVRGLKDGKEEAQAIQRYIDLPFMVIDDLGVDKRTDFSMSVLYEIIEGRDMAYKRGMIITSNLSLGALAERMGDDRIASRIGGLCRERIIEIVGKDRRMTK